MEKMYSSRLEYRAIKDTDWQFFLRLNLDRQVMKYICDPLDEQSIRTHYFEPRLQYWHKGCKHWLCLIICKKGTNIPIGITGFIERNQGVAEVGFIISKEYHGEGYGRESLWAISRHAFDTVGYHKLVATVTSGNLASCNTLMSIGFQQEGTLRKSYYLDGNWQDDWLFGLLKEEFNNSNRL